MEIHPPDAKRRIQIGEEVEGELHIRENGIYLQGVYSVNYETTVRFVGKIKKYLIRAGIEPASNRFGLRSLIIGLNYIVRSPIHEEMAVDTRCYGKSIVGQPVDENYKGLKVEIGPNFEPISGAGNWHQFKGEPRISGLHVPFFVSGKKSLEGINNCIQSLGKVKVTNLKNNERQISYGYHLFEAVRGTTSYTSLQDLIQTR